MEEVSVINNCLYLTLFFQNRNFADSAADEEENLFGDDYNTAFVKTLLRV